MLLKFGFTSQSSVNFPLIFFKKENGLGTLPFSSSPQAMPAYPPVCIWNSSVAPAPTLGRLASALGGSQMGRKWFYLTCSETRQRLTYPVGFCHEAVTSRVTSNTQIILKSKAYKGSFPYCSPTDLPRAAAARLWKALGFIPQVVKLTDSLLTVLVKQ